MKMIELEKENHTVQQSVLLAVKKEMTRLLNLRDVKVLFYWTITKRLFSYSCHRKGRIR